jgi:hypothetical protein
MPQGFLMLSKRLSIPRYFKTVNDLLGHLKLDTDAPYKSVALAIQYARGVPEKPIHTSTWVGVPQRAAPGPFHYLKKARKTRPEGPEVKPLAVGEVTV